MLSRAKNRAVMHSVTYDPTITEHEHVGPQSAVNAREDPLLVNVICKPYKRLNTLGLIQLKNVFDTPHAPFHAFMSLHFQ